MLMIDISTHEKNKFRGALVAGYIEVGGHSITIESIRKLRLPIIGSGPSDGYVDLLDGTHINVPTVWSFLSAARFEITGEITIHTDSLGKDLSFSIEQIYSIDRTYLPNMESQT